jgi:ribonuclease P protein component
MRGAGQFAGALKKKPIAMGATVKIHFAPMPADQPSAHAHGLGIVAPKKLLRTSVRRNAAKRQVREAFRLTRARLRFGNYVFRIVGNERALPVADWQRLLRRELDQLLASVTLAAERAP